MIRPIGREISSLRERHDLSQKKLAESLYGIRQDNIAHWEKGRRNCPPWVFWVMVKIWDGMDLRTQEEEWKEKYALGEY